MPKIRGIHPGYWTDEDVVELSIPARLLLIGLGNLACDNGHVDDKPRQIKMRLLPADDVDTEALLQEIEQVGKIERAGGYITIRKFSLHQKPHKRWWSTCDQPGCSLPDGAGPPLDNGGGTSTKQVDNGGTTVEPPLHTVDHGVATTDVDVDVDVDGEETISSEVAIATPDKNDRADINQLCDLLDHEMRTNGTTTGNGHLVRNRDAARLLLDKDGWTVEQVAWIIRWSQNDEFWRTNILSMSKLRDKFDQLKARATTPVRTARPTHNFDAAFARAAERDRNTA